MTAVFGVNYREICDEKVVGSASVLMLKFEFAKMVRYLLRCIDHFFN